MLPCSIIYGNTNYEVKSKIKNFIVYQQGAQINRTVTYTVRKGVTELHIQGISSQINAQTMQIQATGNIVIMDTKHHIIYPEPNPQQNLTNEIPLKIQREILMLQDSLFDLSYELIAIQNQIDVLNSEKRIIENNGTIKGVGKVNDSIPLLQDALSFYHKEMNNINMVLLKHSKMKLLLSKKQGHMNARLNDLNNYNRNNQNVGPQNPNPIHEIIITISADDYVTGTLNVSYLVNNAGWTPLYDLRSTSKKQTIELTYKAQVYQNTGIDWESTNLTLSTNNPYTNKTKPNLNPWYLDYYNNYNAIPNPGYDKDLEAKRMTSINGGAVTEEVNEMDQVSSTKALTPESFMTMVDQLVSVEYGIDLPYTIKSDNQKNMVLVKNISLETNYLYYAVPKLDRGVYLIAQITNLDELNLIPGNATIFHEGSYLGNTYINPNSLSDTMDLSLGKASNIVVERHLIKNATKEKVVGDKIEKTFAYQIEVKNLSQKTIELVLEDQLPVARDNTIEVEIVEISKGKLNEISGIINWREKIKPMGLNKYELIYTITYSKEKPINLAFN